MTEFERFLASDISISDYMFIDPPWNYPPSKYDNDFWRGLSYFDLFMNLAAPTLFIYVTLDKLPQLISGSMESSYELKGLIPYCKVLKNEDAMYSIAHTFRAPLQYVAVFQTKAATPFHEANRSIIVEKDNAFQRPIKWEDTVFQIMTDQDKQGVYILPTGQVGSCDCNTCPKFSTKELF